jgi:tRNA acetyltransferase TAN1
MSSKPKKRQYVASNKKHNNFNPKRGGPGVLLTCERGREFKCQREGIYILQHYSTSANKNDDDVGADVDDADTSLSLEEELKLLKSKDKKKSGVGFAAYDTGCMGTVFVLCTKPGCNLIPPIRLEKSTKDAGSTEKPDNDEDVTEEASIPQAKKTRVEAKDTALKESVSDGDQSKNPEDLEATGTPVSDQPPSLWDPIQMVRSIHSDLQNGSKNIPSSRFVTRMIPIQATCFSSIEEIRATTQALIAKYLPPTTKSFAIATKRRICENVRREQIIDTIAKLVVESNPNCKVDLENPEMTIVVEVCKTLCGISIIRQCHEFHNFNVETIRENAREQEHKEEEGEQTDPS